MTSTFLFHLALAVDDVELRDDRQGLEPDRKAEQVLVVSVVVGAGEMEQHGHDGDHRVDEKVVVEGVSLGVVAQAVGLLRADEVNNVRGGGNEQKFEKRVIEGNVG